jgi:hypothetical protein
MLRSCNRSTTAADANNDVETPSARCTLDSVCAVYSHYRNVNMPPGVVMSLEDVTEDYCRQYLENERKVGA